ncbi:F-box domain-containing protein [Mycena sanguinolenta]|uniref:F-box domain-containing protein n=1 Tax=Mycena sanguinolenta TaxID=230812 RepID=A0A8H6Z673_9AGAR|nr:F-box domain-containing protein [Mycena sanguinolenta]
MMSLAEFPQDLLIELTKQLDIQELLNLLATCRVLCKLQHERSLWLDALIRIKEVDYQPLPLSTAIPLEKLFTNQLQDVARQALRLRKNLQSDKPRHFQLHSFSVRTSPRIKNIFFIPGTHLVVTNTYGSMDCWDITTAQRVGHLRLPGLWVRTESAVCMDETGKTLLAGCIHSFGTNSIQNLVAICVDFHDRTQISISHVISPPTSLPYSWTSGFFIDSRMMGFVAESVIVSWRMDAAAAIEISPQDVVDGDRANCVPWGRSIYVLPSDEISNWGMTSDGLIQILAHPMSAHPISDREIVITNTFPTSTFPTQYPSDIEISIRTSPQVLLPHYGIFAVTCRSFTCNFRTDCFSMIHFRPAHAKSVEDDLEFSQGAVYKHHDHIYDMAAGISGTYVLVRVRVANQFEESYLGLVHFSGAAVPHITFRKLDVDGKLVASCAKIALDDALGLVLLLDWEGKMTIFSYL